jgi:hypothetical protein
LFGKGPRVEYSYPAYFDQLAGHLSSSFKLGSYVSVFKKQNKLGEEWKKVNKYTFPHSN